MKSHFTPVDNILFDFLLKDLSNAELKILLVIIRQTEGWVNKENGQRKNRDRISYSQFTAKTGLSRRSISQAIESLSQKQLIVITNSLGQALNHPSSRKGQYAIFYSPHLVTTRAKIALDIGKKCTRHVQKTTYNKRKEIKERKNNESDYLPIKEILEPKQKQWKLIS